MDAPAGTLIAYATAPNDVAEDGKGRNGTYTSNLLKNMATTGLPVELVFKRVRDGVIKDSNNLQVPWEATSLSGKDFYFVADSEKPDILPKSIKSVEPEKPKESTLSITADVSGAEVWLDGKNYGQLPRKLTLTGAGKYKLEIIAPGYNKYQISKDVELGNEYEIVAHLEREPEPVKTSVDESESSSSQVKQKPKYILRSKEKEVSSEEAPSVFGLKYGTEGFLVPIEYIKNNFKDNGDGTITDHATGLMWQKSGSWEGISGYDYTRELQKKKFAGYDDWREPTVDELKSLLTQEKQSNGMHINPIFDQTQSRCSTSDRVASDYISGYWGVNFKNGFVNNYNNWRESLYIRAVRSLK